MPFKYFRTPAGPCPSPEPRSPCLLPSESGYSFIDVSETRPGTPPPDPSIPDIILQSSRFASIQNKIKKALKVPAKSGFTKTVPPVAQEQEEGGGNQSRGVSVDSVSIGAMYEGLPVSPSESCFSNSNVSHVQMSPAPLAGLGLLLPVPGTNELRCLSSLLQRSISPIRILETVEVPPLAEPLPGSACRYTRYAGLGHGLPSHMRRRHRQRTHTASSSNNRVTSSVRTITQVFSGSYAYTLGPALTRCPPRVRAAPRIGMSVTWARHHRKRRGYGGIDETIMSLKRGWAAISRRVHVKTRTGGGGEEQVRSRFVEVEIL
ncbi:hypothetical protein FB45DRAFT_899419 [Roridomyces roridus]|uniref:Uncharacterized protein n=1 Tax=Roridomyces roridus TaxID=1738132 RepID=A0AAD7C7E1_9AGAR|nr:hypothetical protein FB45DRAFT_899419 [Roridomyces roridus]